MIRPGSTLGLLGGGPMGRMIALAARRMGYRTVVLEPAVACPAAKVCDHHIQAPLHDPDAVRALAVRADVVMVEYENVQVTAIELLESLKPVRPGAASLGFSQDRVREKTTAAGLGIATPPFSPASNEPELAVAVERVGFPAFLKTRRLGLDGRAIRRVSSQDEALSAFRSLGQVPCLFEKAVSFEKELSVVVVRSLSGQTVTYPVAENIRQGSFLETTIAPAQIPEAIAAQARAIAVKLAETLGLVGVLTAEFFLTPNSRLLFHSFSPRPHPSGHYTVEACATSQFEQQVRASVGAAPGSTRSLSPAATIHLPGELWKDGEPRFDRILELPDVSLHLYERLEARPGLAMGHLTVLATSPALARARAQEAKNRLWGAERDPSATGPLRVGGR